MSEGANVKIKGFSGTEMMYDNVPKIWLAAQESTDDNPVLVPFTYGEALENVPVVPDFSQGDMLVTMPEGYMARSAVAIKPEALIPENIAEGVTIAGVTGEFRGGSGGGMDELLSGTAVEIHSNAKTVLIDSFKENANLEVVDLPEATSLVKSAYWGACALLYGNAKIRIFSAPKAAFNGTLQALQNNAALEEYILPGFTGEIPASMFNGCSSLKTVNLAGATSQSTYTFQGCSRLESVDVRNVATVSQSCFQKCTALKRVDLHKATSIGNNAFSYCTSLTALILRSTTKVTADSRWCPYSSIASGTGYIYVPSSLVSTYNADTNYSAYKNQIRAIEDYPEICG